MASRAFSLPHQHLLRPPPAPASLPRASSLGSQTSGAPLRVMRAPVQLATLPPACAARRPRRSWPRQTGPSPRRPAVAPQRHHRERQWHHTQTRRSQRRSRRANAIPDSCQPAFRSQPRSHHRSRSSSSSSRQQWCRQRRRQFQCRKQIWTPARKRASDPRSWQPRRLQYRRHSLSNVKVCRRRTSAILKSWRASTPPQPSWCRASIGSRVTPMRRRGKASPSLRPRPPCRLVKRWAFVWTKLESDRHDRHDLRAEAGRWLRAMKKLGSPLMLQHRTAALVPTTLNGATRALTSMRMTGPSK